MRSVLCNVDGNTVDAVDKLAPEMLGDVLPQAFITDSIGKNPRPFVVGKAKELSKATYQDTPCWFRPWMALVLLLILLCSSVILLQNKKRHKK